MVNTDIRLIIFFAAKDGEAIYSQQKQDQELIVPQKTFQKIHVCVCLCVCVSVCLCVSVCVRVRVCNSSERRKRIKQNIYKQIS